jgi:steroid delta-isomerase-like uncharacterized protein
MTRDEVQALFSTRQAAFARHDSEALAALHAVDGVVESPMAGGVVMGRAAIEQVYAAWFAAFPDVSETSDEWLIDGDRVVQIATYMGSDTGGFMGMPATGKPFRVPIVLICTVRDGLIAHERRIYDFTGVLMQIGVLKARPV